MRPNFDPQDLPVLRVDGHLPAVPADRLSAAALRQRFADLPLWTPEVEVERRFHDRPLTAASVLVPLVERDAGLTVLLTQRSDRLSDHPGQVSFPGGRSEPDDANPAATALREVEEEIGLHARHIEVLGELPTYTTGSGFVVTPVVALIATPFELAPDPWEVAEIFEVPLAFLMNPAHHRHHAVDIGGMQREFIAMPFEGRDASGAPRRHFIWGATAAMLRNVYRFLSAP